MSGPVVTVLMPMFNASAHVREAIESVLAQSFRDFELLIVDDGSTDDSVTIAESFDDRRIRVVQNESNLGLVESLNRGLEVSRGDWIARQDADDVSHPMRLGRQLEFVCGNPTVSLIGSDASLVSAHGRNIGRWRTGGHADLVAWDLCFRTPFCHSTALFRREKAIRMGGYRDRPACEDYDLWARFGADGVVVTLRDPLVKYRLHERSIMAQSNKQGGGNAALRECLSSTIQRTCPGIESQTVESLLPPWSGGEVGDWSHYFAAVGDLQRSFLRGRRPPPGFVRLCSDQNYMLWTRARNRGDFLKALTRAMPGVAARLPFVRMAGATLLRR